MPAIPNVYYNGFQGSNQTNGVQNERLRELIDIAIARSGPSTHSEHYHLQGDNHPRLDKQLG